VSGENTIARSEGAAARETDAIGFEIPPEVATRYQMRIIDGAGPGEQRLGLFRSWDREIPAIEITDNRIVARSEDAETIASLVKIAHHNGWDRIDVDGSAEFRKAVWSAATRAGLDVSGYDPTFAEHELVSKLRRGAAQDQDAGATEKAPAAPQADAPDAAIPSKSTTPKTVEDQPLAAGQLAISEADRGLLLTLSRHTEDRKALYGQLGESDDTFRREVQFERIDVYREALKDALERVLTSPTLVKAFERSGYEPEAQREMGKGGAWETEVSDAIYLVRSGLHRDALAKDAGATAALVDQLDAERDKQSVAESIEAQARPAEHPSHPVRAEHERTTAAERHESEELAELFLHGGIESLAAEPRLANALQAQMVMEQHIGAVFEGDAGEMVSASLESRKMISDVLRRGLDVSVREPTPVRQIETMHSHPELER